MDVFKFVARLCESKNFISVEGFVLLFQSDANQSSHLEGDELNPCVLTQLL